MSKKKLAIRFPNLYMLWQFAQAIQAKSIEIRTADLLLFCDCSEEDLKLVEKYKGAVMESLEAIRN